MASVTIDPDRYRAVLLAASLCGERGALDLIESLRRHDVATAVVSAPATFSETALRLGTEPSRCLVIEDVAADVDSGHGDFALIVRVDLGGRTGPRRGADIVVTAFSDITVSRSAPAEQRRLSSVPDPLTHWDGLAARLRGHRPILVFDFDGTLAPIEDDPAGVTLPPDNRRALHELSRSCPVAILSGRDLRDVRDRVQVPGLWYAGSHGFEMADPADAPIVHRAGESALPELDAAQQRLASELEPVPGVLIDRKRFALAVHYRHVGAAAVDRVVSTVERIGESSGALKTTHGRLVVELLPDVEWNKGQALLWLLEQLGLADETTAVPLYAGDDITDEDALHAIHDRGVGIVVLSSEHGDRTTWAHYAVDSTDSLTVLLSRIASLLGNSREPATR